jgi:AcrR family transcriptional regulator
MARRDAEFNRGRLLLAARDAVAEEGPGIGVREIAERANVGVSTLYRHFPGKEALIDGVSVHRWATMARLAQAGVQDRDPLVPVLRVLDAYSRMVTADDDFIIATGLRIGRAPPGILPLKARFEPVFAHLWADAQRRELIRPRVDPRDAVELAGMIRDPARRGPMLRTLLTGICTDRVDVARALARVRPSPTGAGSA